VEKNGVDKLKSEYIPGKCNIGPAERRARRMIGWIGLVMAGVLLGIFIFTHTPQIWRLFILIPATIAASGFLQSSFHFCAGFGMRGVFNFGPEVGKTDRVKQVEYRKKDRRKAIIILILSLIIGAVAAVAAFLFRI
jgi:hypothetical protein